MNLRWKKILQLLEENGEMTIKALSDALNVSAMTIHRDLDALQDENFLYKKRGAAVFINQPDREKNGFYSDEKRAIGRYAASLVKPGQSILFDNSTTAIEVAKCLSGIPKLTFYTTNLEIANIVASYPDTVLYCSGGFYFKDSNGFLGSQAEAFVESVQADICFIGASGIDINCGITCPYPMHVSLQQKIIQSSDYRILTADHSKFGKRALEKFSEIGNIDRIITDSGISAADYEKYSKHITIDIAT